MYYNMIDCALLHTKLDLLAIPQRSSRENVEIFGSYWISNY